MENRETENIEHKQSLSDWKAIVESVAAFATSSGGTIIVGINPEGKAIGVSIGKGAIEDLANKIKMNTDPVQLPSVNIVENNDKWFVEIKVMACPMKPVMAFGRPFKRVGNTNQRLSQSEFKTLSLANQNVTWDAIECKQMRMEDIDRKAIREYLKISGLQGQNVVLKNLNLVGEGDIFLNGAVLLFAKRPTKFFIQAILKCGRFAGIESVDFIDQKEFECGIIEQVDRAMSFIKEHTNQAIEFTGAPQHKAVSQYPEKAIREAIVNALCHRDYNSYANTQVRIFDDRLEIWNPGNLPQSLTINKLKGKHESVPKNPKIAYALHRAGLAEQWGTGTNRIINECKENGVEVTFETDQHRFMVTFKPQLKSPIPLNKQVEANTNSPVLNPLQKSIVAYVKKHTTITRRELQALQLIDARKANRELARLVHLTVLKKDGSGKSTVYMLL